VRSCDELKNVIVQHFGFSEHELLAYRSVPDSFVIIFSDRKARDLVFTVGRLIDGPLELSFSAWDLDDFREWVVLTYHVCISIEGIPHHAWSQELADMVLFDEAIIHHVEECSKAEN
jgi:hypothetical protein